MNMIANSNKYKSRVSSPREILRNLGGIKIVNDRLVFVNDIDLLDLIQKEKSNESREQKTPAIAPQVNINHQIDINQINRNEYLGSSL